MFDFSLSSLSAANCTGRSVCAELSIMCGVTFFHLIYKTIFYEFIFLNSQSLLTKVSFLKSTVLYFVKTGLMFWNVFEFVK